MPQTVEPCRRLLPGRTCTLSHTPQAGYRDTSPRHQSPPLSLSSHTHHHPFSTPQRHPTLVFDVPRNVTTPTAYGCHPRHRHAIYFTHTAPTACVGPKRVVWGLQVSFFFFLLFFLILTTPTACA